MTKCGNCKYGDINFWGYQECWKFDRQVDMERTSHTANRERHTMEFNALDNCKFFEKYGLIKKIKDFGRNIF